MDELFSHLRALQKKSSICIVIAAVLVVAGFALLNLVGIVGLACLIPGVICFLIAMLFKKDFAAYYKENVVREVLGEVFSDLTFTPDSGIPNSVIESTRAIQMGNIYQSNDLIVGKYHGVGITQSDVLIQDETTDSDGKSSTTTLFRGRWMIFDFNKEFRCDLQVISKRFYSSKKKNGLFTRKEERATRVKFENEEFNKCFQVYAQNEHEAFYILTPHVIEALLKLYQSMKAPIMLIFTGGILHVAVMNNKDAFEPKMFGRMDPDTERARILGDVSVITKFVDEMSLDRDIYKN